MKKSQDREVESTGAAPQSENSTRPTDKPPVKRPRKRAASRARTTETGAAGVPGKSYTDSLFEKKKNYEVWKLGSAGIAALLGAAFLMFQLGEGLSGRDISSDVYTVIAGLGVVCLFAAFGFASACVNIEKELFEFLRREIDGKRE